MAKMSDKHVCHKIRYDEESIYLYNKSDELIMRKKAKIYRGLTTVVYQSEGTHTCELQDGSEESLVINPRNLSNLSPAQGWQWYVKDCMMKELGFLMATEWKPKFFDTEHCHSLDTEDNIPTILKDCYYPVVPSITTPLFLKHRDDIPLIPLLETLIHVNQEWAGMTLCQIACTIEDRFVETFNDESKVMEFLFEKNRSLFEKLCKVENIPLHELYQSRFNNTYGHNQQNNVDNNHIRVVKHLKDVVMKPLSKIISPDETTYGNIPWLIGNGPEKEKLLTESKFILHPFGFFENTNNNGDVFFKSVSIFPTVKIDERSQDNGLVVSEQTYPSGSMIGITVDENGRTDTILRGKLFETTTTREQIIIFIMYGAFVEGNLDRNVDCTDLLRNLKLNKDQLSVRPYFINTIKEKLLG
jgi:hypothetical protein